MKMQTTRYEFIVRAEEPVAHHSGSIGNVSVFMRKKIRVPGGSVISVPEITGDSIRHKLREAAVYATLDAAGILDDPQLSRGALRLLFNGGMVTGKGDATNINLDRYRQLVALFPPLALFGGCADNRLLPGQLNVDALNCLCSETMGLAPQWAKQWLEDTGEAVTSYRQLTERATRVRMDPELIPEKVLLLSESDQIACNNRLLAQELAHEDGDSIAAGKTKSAMMPRSFERLIQGTLFWGGVEARTYSDLEFDAFQYIFACLLTNFRVGGKAATGHGRLSFVKGCRIPFSLQPAVAEDATSELSAKVGTLYRARITERADELKKFLRSEVNA